MAVIESPIKTIFWPSLTSIPSAKAGTEYAIKKPQMNAARFQEVIIVNIVICFVRLLL